MVLADLRNDRNRHDFLKRNAAKLPRGILERYNAVPDEERREFLNKVVTRSDSGYYEFRTSAALFKEWQRDGSRSGYITRPGKQAARLWGGWGNLADAKERGEVWPVRRNRQVFYQWREFCDDVLPGSDRGGKIIEAPCLKNSVRDSSQQIHTAFRRWGCHLELTENEVMEGQREDAPISPKVFEHLCKVEIASERVLRRATDLYLKMSDLSKTDPLAKEIARELNLDFEAPPT